MRAGQSDGIQGPDRDETGNEQLERCAEPLLSQRKQRRLWERTDGFTDTCYSHINSKGAFVCHRKTEISSTVCCATRPTSRHRSLASSPIPRCKCRTR